MTDFTVADILQASIRLRAKVVRTPVLRSEKIDKELGCRVLFKMEALQRSGAFKFRGASNKLMALEPGQRARGVAAYSSGNHGHAVAAAAALAGCPAVIVIPQDAPAIKVENCRWWGAEVVLYDPATQDRREICEGIASERGMALIPPFDDQLVMAGQGTVGLELAEQLDALEVVPDAVLVPCSGGGLSAGVFTAMRGFYPALECGLVEPAGFEKMARSLQTGSPERRGPGVVLMDGLSGPVTGERPLRVLQALCARPYSAGDANVLKAMALAFRHLKVVLEPAGAAGLAAILQRPGEWAGKNVAVVCSGGNVDPVVFERALAVGA